MSDMWLGEEKDIFLPPQRGWHRIASNKATLHLDAERL